MKTYLELYHHGVKGQHWGTRNGPPYPLYRKSAYYKKTGKRPPGYIGNKSGKEKHGSIGGLSDIKRAGDTSWVRKRLKKDKIGGINDSMSDEERKSKLKKRILIGAGVAAGLAGGALVGRKLYQRKAALGAAGVEQSAKELHGAFLRNRGAQKEASAIKENLDKVYQNTKKAVNAEKAGFVSKKLSLQNEALGLKDKKGILAFIKKRRNLKSMADIEQKLAANSSKAAKAKETYAKGLADNAWNSDYTNAKYERAKKVFENSKKRETLLKKLGNRQALASTLGLGALGGAAGYGTSKLLRSKNQNRGTIGGIPKRLTVSSTDSAVTRRAKQNYNTMSDAEFKRRFSVSKETYAKRVEKYGDPYMNAPLAKLGKRLNKLRRRR